MISDFTTTADNNKFIFNPITRRNVLKNKRNIESVERQINNYKIKHNINNDVSTEQTTEQAQPAQPAQPAEPTETHAEAVQAEPLNTLSKIEIITCKVSSIFNIYNVHIRTVKTFVNNLKTADDTVDEIYNDINKCNNNYQRLYASRVNMVHDYLDKASKQFIKIQKKHLMTESHYNVIQEYIFTFLKRYEDLTNKCISYPVHQSEEVRANYEADEIIRQREHRAEIVRVREYNKTAKKLNDLYDEQMTKWIKYQMENVAVTTKYGKELKLSREQIANIKIDYNYIYSRCNTDQEKELFNKKWSDRLE